MNKPKPYHEIAKIDGKCTVKSARGISLSGNRDITVGHVNIPEDGGGLFVSITRDLKGERSELKFTISYEAAMALSLLLMEQCSRTKEMQNE